MNVSELSPHCNNSNFFKELCRPEKIEILEKIHLDTLKENILSEFYLYRTFKINFLYVTCKL